MNIPDTHRPIIEALRASFAEAHIAQTSVRLEVAGPPAVYVEIANAVNDGQIAIAVKPYAVGGGVAPWVTLRFNLATQDYALLINRFEAVADWQWQEFPDLLPAIAEGLRLHMQREIARLNACLAAFEGTKGAHA